MNRPNVGPWVVSALLAMFALPLAAHPEGAAPDDPAGLARQLDGIRQSLHEIALALDRAAKHQEVDVLMTRLQLKQRGLATIESDLRSVRDQRDGVSDERQRARTIVETLEREVEAQDDSTPNADLRVGLERARGEIELLGARETRLDQRIGELENELRRQRDDVLMLEEKVDERLGLR